MIELINPLTVGVIEVFIEEISLFVGILFSF
jgi:hypothetical protein